MSTKHFTKALRKYASALKEQILIGEDCPERTQKYTSTLKTKQTQNKNLRYSVKTIGSPLGEQG